MKIKNKKIFQIYLLLILKNYIRETYSKAHEKTIWCIIKLNETKIASAGKDKLIKIWDLSNEKCLKELKNQKAVICLAKLNLNFIASGGYDYSIKIWDINSGNCLNSLIGHDGVVLTIIKLSSNLLASGSKGSYQIKIWDYTNGKNIKTISEHSNDVNCLIKLNNNQIVSASRDSTIKIIDYNKGKCLNSLKGHNGAVTSVVKLSKNKIASASTDKTVKLWEDDLCFKTISYSNIEFEYILSFVKISEDYLICATQNIISVYNIILGDYLFKIPFFNEFSFDISCIEMINEMQIIVGYKDGKYKVKDIDINN